MLQARMSEVLRFQEVVLKHGQESPEAWLAMCKLLADASNDERQDLEYWDRHPDEALEAMVEVMDKATRGLVPAEELARITAEAEAAGNLSSSQPSR